MRLLHHARFLLVVGLATSASETLAQASGPLVLPLASRFDLTEAAVRPAYARVITDRDALSDDYALPELSAPPMPPHAPAKLRIRGRKIKLRVPLG